MLVVPVPAEEFLPHIVRTTESCGYAGLIVVLARTADAQAQHEELTRDWTSLHDVTGPLLAILCPDPQFVDHPREDIVDHNSATTYLATTAYVPGLHFQLPSDVDQDAFARSFWQPSSGPPPFQSIIEFEIEPQFSDRRHARPRRPRPEAEHHAAWTLAASRCASYFGIGERSMPSILILCHWERKAVLMVQPRPYLYRLTKAIVESLGDRIESPGNLIQEIVGIRQDIERNEKAVTDYTRKRLLLKTDIRRSQHEYNTWREQVEALGRRLEMIPTLDPSLVSEGRNIIRQLLSATRTVSSGELSGSLRAFDKRITDTTEDVSLQPIQRRIHQQIVKLIAKVESSNPLPSLKQQDPFDEPLRHAQENLQEARHTLVERQAPLKLADTVIATYEHLFGRMRQTDEPGHRGLEGWMLRTLGPTPAGEL
jgi:hypothetical protein